MKRVRFTEEQIIAVLRERYSGCSISFTPLLVRLVGHENG